jgi:hypothetical protein
MRSTIRCTAASTGGQSCGAMARINGVQYKYAAALDPQLAEVHHVLVETFYEIDCPACGPRTQCEKEASISPDYLLA